MHSLHTDFEISPIAAGVVSGGVMFLLVLALAMAAVRKYRNCRSWLVLPTCTNNGDLPHAVVKFLP